MIFPFTWFQLSNETHSMRLGRAQELGWAESFHSSFRFLVGECDNSGFQKVPKKDRSLANIC